MSITLGLSEEMAPAVPEGAGFWVRVLARGIDTLIHYAVGLAVGVTIGVLVAVGSALQGVSPQPTLARFQGFATLEFLGGLIGAIAMHTLAEGLHGSTLGKRLCGLTVVSEDGAPASVLSALKRSIAYFWDALFFGFIAYRKMSESPARQRYGDLWASTRVVRLRTVEAGARRSWGRFLLAVAAGLALDGLILFVGLASRLL